MSRSIRASCVMFAAVPTMLCAQGAAPPLPRDTTPPTVFHIGDSTV
ncbi:MAG: hypothetical protein ABIT20_16155 [Gemmatimonadaceae bacterium]